MGKMGDEYDVNFIESGNGMGMEQNGNEVRTIPFLDDLYWEEWGLNGKMRDECL